MYLRNGGRFIRLRRIGFQGENLVLFFLWVIVIGEEQSRKRRESISWKRILIVVKCDEEVILCNVRS